MSMRRPLRIAANLVLGAALTGCVLDDGLDLRAGTLLDVDGSADAGSDAVDAAEDSADDAADTAPHDVAPTDVAPTDAAAHDVGSDTGDATHDADVPNGGADAPPPDPRPPFPAPLADAIEALVNDAPRRTKAPGVTLTIHRPDLGTWSTAAGLASTETGAFMQPDDRLRIGSVTKTFTAATLLLLERDGLVGLDDPVDDWLPDLALGRTITLRMLLGHTSGIYNFTDDAGFVPLGAEPATPREVIAFAESHARTFEPGQGYNYSNTGYFILGLVIEAVTELTFAEAVHTWVLEPHGLDDTFVQPDDAEAEFVDGHVFGNEATWLVHPSWSWAAGGMISTGADLCTWARQLFSGAVLGDERTAWLVDRGVLPGGARTRYGLGVQHTTRGGRSVVGHTGSTMGFRGELFWEPETETCVALTTNDFFAEQVPLAEDLWDALGDAPAE